MPRRIFPSLRRRRIRMDIREMRPRRSELTTSAGEIGLVNAGPESYVVLESFISS
jgi:hypothetical protein